MGFLIGFMSVVIAFAIGFVFGKDYERHNG